ncbi:hypothetical protein [Catenuloplanes atrovinosus]|uniref:Uncharacterized protein n=1 Tax=Catenuloplanes atrovinosus TaxID=137266 RepID=A0AAE3YUP4_9ACTN|nr:hypothetical protein [Catenuloplanes atrovinosus]MDR7279001.1 hypothetical protein [Catenuloplanes atrovinosus]
MAAVEVWAAITSLGGVAIGGGLSYLVQSSTQRAAARMEERRRNVELAQRRRDERLAYLERFISVAAEAERSALNRPDDWDGTDDWAVRTHEVMNRFWIEERMIRMLFPLPVHEAARAYFLVLNGSVWEGDPGRDSVRDALEEPRLRFLDAARAALE